MRSFVRFVGLALALACFTTPFAGCKKKSVQKEEPVSQNRVEPAAKRPPETDRGRKTIQLFQAYQKDVLGSMKAALAGGGTAAAIPVCKEVSATLADRFAELPSVKVRRVAVRNRNPDHVPDEFEAGIMKEWEEGLANGSQPIAISRDTEEGLRVMQPIVLRSRLCLRCHGEKRHMTPETLEMLQRLYPKDNATGFKVGELRGAFSAIWTK